MVSNSYWPVAHYYLISENLQNQYIMGYHFLSRYWDKIPIKTFYKVLVFTRLGRTRSQYYSTGAIVKTFFN